MIYRVTDGNVHCWVKAKDESIAIVLALKSEYFELEPGAGIEFDLKVIKLKCDDRFYLDLGDRQIEHSVLEWNGIFEGFEDRIICFSEY